jgi:hypothetical protein
MYTIQNLNATRSEKCSNLLTAAAPDDGQQAETCSADQNITHELQQVLKVWFY